MPLEDSNLSTLHLNLVTKGFPLIYIKDQTMPIWIFQQAGESGPNGQSVTAVSYAYDQTGHRPSTTKNF